MRRQDKISQKWSKVAAIKEAWLEILWQEAPIWCNNKWWWWCRMECSWTTTAMKWLQLPKEAQWLVHPGWKELMPKLDKLLQIDPQPLVLLNPLLDHHRPKDQNWDSNNSRIMLCYLPSRVQSVPATWWVTLWPIKLAVERAQLYLRHKKWEGHSHPLLEDKAQWSIASNVWWAWCI